MAWNNDCRFIGNVTHEPYFRRVGRSQTPFLRLYLAVDDARDPTSFLRVVAYGNVALVTYPYLTIGSQLLVHARYRQRQRLDKRETVHEFVAHHIALIDEIDREPVGSARSVRHEQRPALEGPNDRR
ncbi:MAG: single-stranded DNA-binding protein [Anaerolineae bacterium]